MLTFPQGKRKIPFIATQRLLHLQVPEGMEHLTKRCLEPDLFALARRSRKEDCDAFGEHGMPKGCRWQPVDNREAFLMNLSRRRLCLTIDAGIGKTSAMMQLQYLRGTQLNGHLVIGDQFDNLPSKSNDYVDGEHWLLTRLLECSNEIDRDRAQRLLMRKMAQGKFTLLVDALDQVGHDEPEERALALARFLAGIHGEKIHCVVSGLPQAIDTYWESLFEQLGPHEWEFAQIDLFDKAERETFLGPDRAANLKQLDADLVAVPRMLEMMISLPFDELSELRTASDIYWRAIDRMLNTDLRRQAENSLKREPAQFLFSLLAIESLKQGFLNGVSPGKEMKRFRNELRRNRREEIAEEREQEPSTYDLKDDLRRLGKLNTIIEYGVLDTSETLTRLVFRDRTILDFFAALWVVNYANKSDIQWLRDNKFIRSSEDRTYEQFWRFASEMPSAARDDETYSQSMTVLYESERNVQKRHRSTEMLYRTWPTMLQLAGYNVPESFFERDLLVPTNQAQCDAWRITRQALGGAREMNAQERGEQLKKEIEVAVDADETDIIRFNSRRAVMTFLCEYPGVLWGTNGDKEQTIAQDFESWFVKVPEDDNAPFYCIGQDGTTGERIKIEIDGPFQLAKYTVTNSVYCLFDFGDPDPAMFRHPVVDVDYYDAWSVSLFFMAVCPVNTNGSTLAAEFRVN